MIGGSSETAVFNVDISGYKYIKLVSITKGETASASAVSWADACAYSLADASECEHSWNEGEVTTAATCITAGVMTYTCENCSNTKAVSIISAGEHSYDDGAQTKVPSCTACGDTYTEAVDKLEYSYTYDCDVVCHEETREVAHDVVHMEAVEAGCHYDGNIEYRSATSASRFGLTKR